MFVEVDKKLCLEIENEGMINKIYSCPIELVGEGNLKIAIGWRGEEFVVFAGGQCVASNDPATPAEDFAELTLKP